MTSEGELMAFDPVSGRGRDLAENVDLIRQTEASADGLLFFTTTDDATEIRLVDVGSGDVDDFAKGDWPVSSGARVAFCSSPGNLVVADAHDPERRETVGRVSPGCAPMAWFGSRLAFAQIGSSLGLDGATLRLWDGGTLEEVDVAVPVSGIGDLSWSARGTSLLYANGDGELVEVDLASRRGTAVGVGQDPKYSPVDDDLFAVMTDRSVEVRDRAGGTVARHDLPQNAQPRLAEVNFAWSPDGTAIAVVTVWCINVWDWRSEEMSCAIRPSSGAFLPVVLWFP